jgi:5'(3')-deoxyribonucleotidase
MTTAEIIFLDIDGVLADFDSHAEAHNVRRENGKFDYSKLDFKWWSTIPVFDGALRFYEECKDIAEVKFLTGPMLSVDCFQGKAHWIAHKFLPQRGKFALSDLMIMNSKKKQLLATPNRILIDDTKANVDKWREAGGIAIHHTGDYAKTLAELKSIISAKPNVAPAKPPRFNK